MSTAAQKFVPIQDIKNGAVVLKDGSVRIILMVSTVNFSLKSQEEQESILYQFQNFLNSLDFHIQICVQSRKLDIRPYLNLLEERRKEQVNRLLEIQTREYIDFIKSFTEKTDIISKHFYIVVPYTPASLQLSQHSWLDKIKDWLGFGNDAYNTPAEDESFQQRLSQLEDRVAIVEQGLIRTGLQTARLGTDEATELFYQTLNPGETDTPRST